MKRRCVALATRTESVLSAASEALVSETRENIGFPASASTTSRGVPPSGRNEGRLIRRGERE